MLEHHPWFEVAWLAASDRSEGRSYGEAARWRLKTAIPARVAEMRVSPATPEGAPKMIFAALDASIAAEMEPRFAEAGCAVVSNSSALRMQKDVPLVIPEVNPGHIKLIECQAWRKESGGFVVTNPNCSAIGLVMALAPLQRRLRPRNRDGRHHASGQRRGISGRGFAGHFGQCDSLHPQRRRKDGGGNAEASGQTEWHGDSAGGIWHERAVQPRAVEDGHTESVSVKLKKKARPEEIIDAWNEFRGVPQDLKLPSAPEHPVRYLEATTGRSRGLMWNPANGMTTRSGVCGPAACWIGSLPCFRTIPFAARPGRRC